MKLNSRVESRRAPRWSPIFPLCSPLDASFPSPLSLFGIPPRIQRRARRGQGSMLVVPSREIDFMLEISSKPTGKDVKARCRLFAERPHTSERHAAVIEIETRLHPRSSVAFSGAFSLSRRDSASRIPSDADFTVYSADFSRVTIARIHSISGIERPSDSRATSDSPPPPFRMSFFRYRITARRRMLQSARGKSLESKIETRGTDRKRERERERENDLINISVWLCLDTLASPDATKKDDFDRARGKTERASPRFEKCAVDPRESRSAFRSGDFRTGDRFPLDSRRVSRLAQLFPSSRARRS